IGALPHVYAAMLLGEVGADAVAVWNELRLELNVGQYLDLLATARADRDRLGAHRLPRPHDGEDTTPRTPRRRGRLSAAPPGTGKPVGQALREGKPTPLLAAAVERANDGRADVLDRV